MFLIKRCVEGIRGGLIPRYLSSSILERTLARMAELVDACDLKSYPSGCWFNSSYEQISYFFFLRKSKLFNKSRYSRNRQLARVIFYFAIYINVLVMFGVFYVIYGLSFETGWFWWTIFAFYCAFAFTTYIRSVIYK